MTQHAPESSPSPCRICGAVPSCHVVLRTVKSYILLFRRETIETYACRDCGIGLFREVQAQTLVRGWWGPLAALSNLYAVLKNLGTRRALLRLPAPWRSAFTDTPYDVLAVTPRPVLRRPVVALIGVALPALLVVAAGSGAMAPSADANYGACSSQHAASDVLERDAESANAEWVAARDAGSYGAEAKRQVAMNAIARWASLMVDEPLCFHEDDVTAAKDVLAKYGRH